MTDALRPSELFGLRWRDFDYDECVLVLSQTVYRGKLRHWGKTRKALRPIHIPKELADDLWLWKQESKHSEPDDFIFPNRLKKGGFIDPQNYRRKMRKLGEELGLPKLTFQVTGERSQLWVKRERDTQGHPGRIEALAAIDHH